MSNDLRAALESSFNDVEKEEVVPVAEVAPDPSAPQAEPEQRSEPEAAPDSTVSDPVAPPSSEGSETPKSIEEVVGEAITETVEQQETAPTTSSSEIPEVSPDKVLAKIDQPPASWKGEAKQLWKDLPVAARQEVVRRELQTNKILQETVLDRRKVQEITQVLQPHMERIAANYQGNPLVAINGLLQADRVLSSGTPLNKAQLVAKIINDFGVDIATLDNILSGQPPPENVRQQSEVDRLVEEKLRPVLSYVEQQRQRDEQSAQATQARITETVETMAADSTRYPYFEDVRLDMADLIELSTKRGVDLSLEEAYNRAVRMNGHTAAAVEARQSTQAATQTALQAHQEAQRAKGAAVSVAGSPTSTSGPTLDPTDLRGLISSQLNNRGDRL